MIRLALVDQRKGQDGIFHVLQGLNIVNHNKIVHRPINLCPKCGHPHLPRPCYLNLELVLNVGKWNTRQESVKSQIVISDKDKVVTVKKP